MRNRLTRNPSGSMRPGSPGDYRRLGTIKLILVIKKVTSLWPCGNKERKRSPLRIQRTKVSDNSLQLLSCVLIITAIIMHALANSYILRCKHAKQSQCDLKMLIEKSVQLPVYLCTEKKIFLFFMLKENFSEEKN